METIGSILWFLAAMFIVPVLWGAFVFLTGAVLMAVRDLAVEVSIRGRK